MFRIESYPFVLFFKGNIIYRYTGSLKLEDLLKYLSGDNYKNTTISTEYTSDMQSYVAQIDGSFDLVSRMKRIMMN
jgi:thioredoxin-related protein